jgi:translation initiation factor eIF-2B subunit epsilon
MLVGPRSALAQNTIVYQSTLGADCSVGPNTSIISSYIFDDVRIGANCKLEECIIGKEVHISDGVKIGKGALIGNGVRLGKNVTIPNFARVGRERWRPEDWDEDDEDEDDEEEEEDGEFQLSIVGLRVSLTPARRNEVLGPDTEGYLWPQEEEEPPSDSEDEDDDPYEHPRNKRLLQLGRSLSNVTTSTSSLSTLSKASSSPPQSPISIASSSSLPDLPSLSLDAGPPPAFYSEARASLARAFDEGHSIENAILELRTLVMGYNAGIDRAREEVINFLLSRINISGGAAQILASATSVFGRWGKLAESLTTDPTSVVLDVQSYCVENSSHAPWFGIVLRALYETDVVAEEDLVEWRDLSAAQGEGQGEENKKKQWKEMWVKGKAYVDVLEDMESDDDEDDDEEEDEDEED